MSDKFLVIFLIFAIIFSSWHLYKIKSDLDIIHETLAEINSYE